MESCKTGSVFTFMNNLGIGSALESFLLYSFQIVRPYIAFFLVISLYCTLYVAKKDDPVQLMKMHRQCFFF